MEMTRGRRAAIALRPDAIALRLDAIALRLDTTALCRVAMVLRWGTMALRDAATVLRANAMALWAAATLLRAAAIKEPGAGMTLRRYLELLMRTASLMRRPRATASWRPSREKSKAVMMCSLKSVTWRGGPPSTDWLQMLLTFFVMTV